MSKLESTLYVAFGAAAFGLTLAPEKLLGMFFIHIQREFEASASKVSLCIGLIPALSYIYGPLHALLFSQMGAQVSVFSAAVFASFGFAVSSFMGTIEQMTVLFAIFSAFGIGMMNLATFTMSGHVFSCRLSLANNMFGISHSVVTFAAAPITQILIEFYGWRGALLIVGGITLHAAPAALLAAQYYSKMKRRKTKKALKDLRGRNLLRENMSELQHKRPCEANEIIITEAEVKVQRASSFLRAAKILLQNPYFVLYAISMTFAAISRLSVVMYTVRYAQSTGISDKKAVWILTLQELLCIVSGPLAGCLTSGKAKDKEKCVIENENNDGLFRPVAALFKKLQYVPRSYVHAFLSTIFSLSIMLPVALETYMVFLIMGILNGIIVGANIALPVTVLTDLFKNDDLATAQGLRSLFSGIGLIVYPWIVGSLIDITGNYRPAQISAAACSLTSAALTVITQVGLKKKASKSKRKLRSAPRK